MRVFKRGELAPTCHGINHIIQLKGVLGDALLVAVQQADDSVRNAPYHRAKEAVLQ